MSSEQGRGSSTNTWVLCYHFRTADGALALQWHWDYLPRILLIPVCTRLLCLIPWQLLLHQRPHFLPLARGRFLKWASEGGSWLTLVQSARRHAVPSMQLSPHLLTVVLPKTFLWEAPQDYGMLHGLAGSYHQFLRCSSVTLHTAVDAAKDLSDLIMRP